MSKVKISADLRSDTITRPTPPMLEAMMRAEVGDDVLGDDPTVKMLEEKVAALFGMEAALYCPSGTMTNQIALRILTEPQHEVICDKRSHIYLYEGGGMAYNSMLSPKLLDGDRGRITAAMVEENINPDDVHYPVSSLVSVENTVNKGGGSIYKLEEIQAIKKLCVSRGLNFHMDGARLFNALVETGEDPKVYGALFDTISVCFSKGLGAPVGSALVGSTALIKKAKRVRKALGGGMRQAGYLAAACIYALDHHVERLKEDHARARKIGQQLADMAQVKEVFPVETNIVIAELNGVKPAEFLGFLGESGVYGMPFGSSAIRFVTHLDFDDDKLEHTLSVLRSVK